MANLDRPIRYSGYFLLVLLAFLFIAGTTASAAPATLGENHYGGSQDQTGETVWQTSDNGFIIVGTGPDTAGISSNMILVKTDASGNQVWSKNIGGMKGYSVRQTSDGGYIATGSLGDNLYLARTDASGNKQWDKEFVNASSLQSVGYSVQQTSDGGYIVVGEVSASSSYWNMDLLKTDASGNKQWESYYGPADSDIRMRSVWQTSDGGYIMGGQVKGGYNEKPVIVKADATGNIQWGKTYEGPGIWDNFGSEKYGIQQTRDGGYIYAGAHSGAVYLLKTDANGNKQWDHDYGVADSSSGANSVQQTWDDGYVLAGFHPKTDGTYNVYVVRTDANGNQLWENTYQGLGYADANSVLQIGDGSYVVTGWTKQDNNGNNNVYLLQVAKDMTPVPNAKVESDNIPTIWDAGKSYTVYVTFNNIGTMPWTFQDNTTFGHQGDAGKFGVTGANMTIPIGTVIRPGQSQKYSFTMTAPGENGTYNPRFQMVWEGHQMFGAVDNKTITVVNGTGPAASTALPTTSGVTVTGAPSAAATQTQPTTAPTTAPASKGLPCLSSLVLPLLAIGVVTVSISVSRKRGNK